MAFSLVASSAQYMPDTNLPGGDLTGADFSLPNSSRSGAPWNDETGPAECVKACDANEECTGWTYVRTGGPKPRCPRCARYQPAGQCRARGG